jgi:hypothetical protein
VNVNSGISRNQQKDKVASWPEFWPETHKEFENNLILP